MSHQLVNDNNMEAVIRVQMVTNLTPIYDLVSANCRLGSQQFKATTSDQRDHALADSYNYSPVSRFNY
jgi:hypothetical protein